MLKLFSSKNFVNILSIYTLLLGNANFKTSVFKIYM